MVKRHLKFCFGPNLGLRLVAGTKLNKSVYFMKVFLSMFYVVSVYDYLFLCNKVYVAPLYLFREKDNQRAMSTLKKCS